MAFLISIVPPVSYFLFHLFTQTPPIAIFDFLSIFWFLLVGPFFIFLSIKPKKTSVVGGLSSSQHLYINRIIMLFTLSEISRSTHKTLSPQAVSLLYFYRAALAYALQIELLATDYAQDAESLKALNLIIEAIEKAFLSHSDPQIVSPYLQQLFDSEKFLFAIIGSFNASLQKNIIWGQAFNFENLELNLSEQIKEMTIAPPPLVPQLIYDERFSEDLDNLIKNTIYALPYENFAVIFEPILLVYYLSALSPETYSTIGKIIQSIFDIGFGYRRWWGPYLTLLNNHLEVLPSPNLNNSELDFLKKLSGYCSQIVDFNNARISSESPHVIDPIWLLNQDLRAQAALEVKKIFPLP
jgi:hypothetical protein